MESRAKLFGHPIHQMLVPLPFGLLATSVIFDVVAIVAANGYWSEIAYWMIAAGLAGGLVAAPFGLIDWLAIPRATRAKRVGALHGIGNVVALLLFGTSWLVRRGDPSSADGIALALSFIGVTVAAVAGWLGGELVDRLGVGIDDGAHLDASSSLHGPATRTAPRSR